MTHAACAGLDAFEADRIFFPQHIREGANWRGPTAQARQICQTCPVQENCLLYALNSNIQDGIYGGASPDERRRLRRRAHA